jgi:hypothetical protein
MEGSGRGGRGLMISEKENPALASRVPVTDLAGASITTECGMSQSKLQPIAEREIMLGNLRCAVARVRDIAEQLSLVGIVLKHGTISIAEAREWADEVAPGCLIAIEASAFPFNVGA